MFTDEKLKTIAQNGKDEEFSPDGLTNALLAEVLLHMRQNVTPEVPPKGKPLKK